MKKRTLHWKRTVRAVMFILLMWTAGMMNANAQLEGALNDIYTINDNGDKVCLSQGNLQHIGSSATPNWKFADYQLDYFIQPQGRIVADQLLTTLRYYQLSNSLN